MSTNGLPQGWADQFGLALSPLFGTTEMVADCSHAVLLDGGYGSFAMSETHEELWRDEKTSCWAWSSNLPHHVTVTDNVVAVTRWDSSEAEVASRRRLKLSTAISPPIVCNPLGEWLTMCFTCSAACGPWSLTQIFLTNKAQMLS